MYDVPTSTFEDSDGESNMRSADKDNTIDVIYDHSELTVSVVCVCLRPCVVCVCACMLLVYV